MGSRLGEIYATLFVPLISDRGSTMAAAPRGVRPGEGGRGCASPLLQEAPGETSSPM